MWGRIASRVAPGAAFISGASGAGRATAAEQAFLAEHSDIPVRATDSYIGHGMEPAFPMNVALAALALSHGKLFAPRDPEIEKPMPSALKQAIVTGVGYWRGEGMALVEAA
jgi:3-oxoacyl-[acyl-carrier-protein] synthase II